MISISVHDPRFTTEEHITALSIRNQQTFMQLMGLMQEPKVTKSLTLSEKMFKSIKESGLVIADVLNAFLSAGEASDVFGTVVAEYTGYLSNMFWKEVLEGIDWDIIHTIMVDILGPVFENIGAWVGGVFESAPVGASIGALIGQIASIFLPGGPLLMIIGGLIGAGVEWLINTLAEIFGEYGYPTAGGMLAEAVPSMIEYFHGPEVRPEVGKEEEIWYGKTEKYYPEPELPERVERETEIPEAKIYELEKFQKGGIPEKDMIGLLEQNDVVIPLDELYMKFDDFNELLTEIRDYQRKMWLDKEYRHR